MRRLLFWAAILAALILASLPQWRSLDRMGDRRFRALAASSTEVVVGVCWPSSVNQDRMLDGLRMAQQEIGDGHLAGDFTIRLVERDDSFSASRARQIALEFADTPDMSAVIGYYDDGPAVRASAIYESSRLLHLIIGANDTAMTAREFRYLVRTVVSNDKIARSVAGLMAARGYKRIALIWERETYGEDLANKLKVAIDARDMDLDYQWSYTRDQADFRLPVNQLKETRADAVFFAGLEPWAGDFLREARAVGVSLPIVGAFGDTPGLRQHAGEQGLRGAMFYDLYDPEATTAENLAFVKAFRARYGRTPDTWAAQAYDALHLLARALKTTGSRNPLDLAYAIRYGTEWHGANGRYKFDSTGNVEDKPIFINQYHDGVPVVVQSSSVSDTPDADRR